MIIQVYDNSRKEEVRDTVLEVLFEHGFVFDRIKDADLQDIEGYYFKEGGVFYIGLAEGKVVGTAAVRRIDRDRCEIRRIYLKKEFRGKGYGKKLFLAALSFAENNFSSAELKTDPSLTKAIDMYLKHGFSFLKDERGYLYFKKEFKRQA